VSRLVYGVGPVRELVRARPQSVNVVYVAAGDVNVAIKELTKLCVERKVTVEERERRELDALAGSADARHQGIVAITGEFEYQDLDDVLDRVEGPPLVVVLDGVEDPRNLGAIVRSAHVLGAHAVVVAKDRAAPVTPVTVKTSAGATEHLPICRVTNIVRALESMKERGIWVVGALAHKAQPPERVDLTGPIAIVLGAEGKGIRPLVEKNCDHRVEIPMVGQVASLNVSVAAGVLLYEAVRQRASKRR
jgi:23S rRNA (guanosine2251-2'-O)-methyltransferase